MPAPPNRTTIEARIADSHTVELQNKDQRAQSAYVLLNSYNWNSTGGMPSPFTWQAPNGGAFTFDTANGELAYDATIYSSLSSVQKQGFFQYLPAFIAACMKNYDVAYGL